MMSLKPTPIWDDPGRGGGRKRSGDRDIARDRVIGKTENATCDEQGELESEL